MIQYSELLDDITPERLTGFFVGWPNPPSAQAHVRILHGSQHRLLAIDTGNGRVVGFITALSDEVSAAYIPHLEVLPEYQGQGIGTELVRRMLDKLRHLYMIDLICDTDLQPFYQRLGMRPYTGMVQRNYDRQACD